ncbi:MAG: acyl-CoA thioesterase [Marivivens sp.]|nr:acyl-CoA thioesterase [Marivivens sp.]
MWKLQETVRWSDVDKLGHANNQAYWRWCENARNEQALAVGLGEPDLKRPSQIIATQSGTFRAPLFLHDEIVVVREVTRFGTKSHEARYLILKSNVPVFEAVCTIVLFDFAKGRAVPYPEEVKRLLLDSPT